MTVNNDWKAFLVQTTTGVIGPEIRIKEGANYSIPLDSEATFKFALDKTDLPNVDLDYWLAPWWSTILVTYQDRAIYAGPIISNPKEYANEIQFDSSDIRSVLARRYIISEQALSSASIAKGVVSYKGKSLGTIAQDVVGLAMRKPGGNLPITFASKRQFATNDADHQRTYKAYNANTISVDEVLTKISEVTQGPDIMFRPKLINDAQMVWEMYHGTEEDMRIAQKTVPQWDLTPVKTSAASLEVTVTGSYLTDRVIGVGGGTNEATVMTMVETDSRIRRGYPLLESVTTVSDSENKTVILKHARSSLKQNQKPLREYTFFVDVEGTYPFGTYWPGNLIALYVKGFRNLPDGLNEMRLLNMSGTFGSSKVRLSLQLDSQWK